MHALSKAARRRALTLMAAMSILTTAHPERAAPMGLAMKAAKGEPFTFQDYRGGMKSEQLTWKLAGHASGTHHEWRKAPPEQEHLYDMDKPRGGLTWERATPA